MVQKRINGNYQALIYALFVLLTSCAEDYRDFSGAVWVTTYHISYKGNESLADSAIAVMASIDDELSMFNPMSTVSKINSGNDLRATEMFTDIFRLSQKINGLSGGAFDPTVGPLTNLWGFGTHRHDAKYTPSQAETDSVLQYVGIADCRIEDGMVIKKHRASVFDFSSVAKGYGVDEIGRMLRRNGCDDFLIEIGGEVLASGKNRKGQTWRVQVDAPASGISGHKRLLVIEIDNAAIATSGNYRNFRDTARGRIGHTLNPATGAPAVCPTVSATVIAPDCATADALATACMVMKPEKAIEMIESTEGVEALLVVNVDDSLSAIFSSEFPR